MTVLHSTVQSKDNSCTVVSQSVLGCAAALAHSAALHGVTFPRETVPGRILVSGAF